MEEKGPPSTRITACQVGDTLEVKGVDLGEWGGGGGETGNGEGGKQDGG